MQVLQVGPTIEVLQALILKQHLQALLCSILNLGHVFHLQIAPAKHVVLFLKFIVKGS